MTAARSLKLAGVLLAATLAAGTLTACQTRVGAAAFIGSTRISESTVDKYLGRNAATTIDSSTGQPDNPKSDVVDTLVVLQLFNRVFQAKLGGQPTQAQVNAAGAAVLAQGQIPSISAVEDNLVAQGFTRAYALVQLEIAAKESLLEAALKDTNDSVLIKTILDLHIKVSVSPRYGEWDPNALTLSSGPSVPSFLTLATAPSTETGDGTSG